MNILYDYQAFTMQYFGGVSKCFCDLISNFPKDVNYTIALKQSNNIHIKESRLVHNLDPVFMDHKKFREQFAFKGGSRLFNFLCKFPFFNPADKINKNYAIELLRNNKYDVFHPTFFDTYFLEYIKSKPFVITVHDMMPEIFQDTFGFDRRESFRKKLLCEKSSAIVAVSENTKKDLVRIMNIPEDKIKVIYHGSPTKIKVNDRPMIDDEYFLYVGMRDRYKNFLQTLKDFAVFREKHKDVKLVCTGKIFSKEEFSIIEYLNLENSVIQKFVTENELANLYTYALAFIYPSLYEGFGMPILESFVYNCPCLLNNKSCFPEIAADAAIYFNSDDTGSNLSEKMEELYSLTSVEKENLLKKSEQRLRLFSWQNSALELVKLYNTIL